MKRLLNIMLASIVFLGVAASFASAQTMSEVQAAIKAKGANWVAGETSMSTLTLEQKRNMMGLIIPPEATHPPISQPAPVGLPVTIDWRNNGGNYVSDVKSQGACNSCWAFSTTAAVESAIMIANKSPNLNLDLMEAVLISCCTNCSPRVCGSGYLGPAAEYMVSHGEPLQTCSATDCGYACPNQMIKSWESIPGTVDSLRAAIANYGPVVAGMHVYNDFYNYTGGVYSYTGASYVGDHAVAVVGYDDAGQYFIGKNSWGTDWGEKGFFRIAYSEVTGTSAFGIQSVAYHGGDPNPPPSPTCTSYPIGDYFTVAGGTGKIQVSTVSGCAWTAASNVAWITINSGTSGTGPGSVAFTVAANTTSSARTGTITVPGGTYTVVQGQGSVQCTYAISPTSNSFTTTGGAGSVSVTAGSGCSWTATSGASWITVTGGASGSGNGTVNYSVSANTATSSRSGTMTIAGKTFTVNQTGASCAYTINPTSNSFTASAGSGSVSVTSATGCAWTAASNANWITINSGVSSSGSGSVSYSVAANTTTSARTGTLTIGGQTFTVNQAAMVCTYTISPTSNSYTSAAGTGSVSVTSPSGCAWTATSNATWITVTGAASGSGNGTVNHSVSANTATSSRSGTLTIAGKTFTVNQAAMACTYAISPTSNSFTYAAGTGSVSVTSPTGCAWSAVSNASWITVSSGASGSANGTVNYSVAANTSTSQRSGTMTIAGQAFTVNQAAMACTYTISPTSNSVGATAGTGSVSVTSATGCAWTATSGASSSGNGTVSYSVAANSGSASRSGTLTVAGQTFTVNQAAGVSPTCSVMLTIAGINVGYNGREAPITVYAASACSWTATTNVSWITFPSGATGKGNGTIYFAVAANPGPARTGTININGSTVFVNQQGGGNCTYTISPASNSVGATAGTGSVSVTSATGCAWTATSNATSWLTVTGGASGSGNGTVSYAVTANSGTTSRTGSLTVGGQTFTVTQAGVATCSYAMTPMSQSFASGSGNGTVSVTSPTGCSWTAASNASWIRISAGASGSGNGTVSYSVTANTNTASRTDTITIAGKTFTVSQQGVPTCSVYTTAGGFNAPYTGRQLSFPVYASGTCSWSAVANVPWITFTSGATGSGNGSVIFSVDYNSGPARTGTVTVNGTSVFVNQGANPSASASCTFTISPAEQAVTASANLSKVSVSTGPGCMWSATSSVPWISISTASGSGAGSVLYSVTPNMSSASRTGTMIIGGKSMKVTQAAPASSQKPTR